MIAEKGDKEKFCACPKMHQEGKTGYPIFCDDCAETGIERWYVSVDARTCTYYDKVGNEILVEGYRNKPACTKPYL